MDNPKNIHKVQEIKSFLGWRKLSFIGALAEDIRKYLDKINNDSPKYKTKMDKLISELDSDININIEAEEQEIIDESDNTIIKLSNQIICDAFDAKASDVHIEPNNKNKPTTVRFRIDGECVKALEIPSKYKSALISRFKIMSGLNIAQKRLPQSGKINFRLNNKELELRVEVTPTVGGNEDIVLRLLGIFEPRTLDKMNLSEYNLKNFLNIISQPYGLILVVGPTGSGKTTTLHSAIKHINKPEKKIWSAEDPVEITQDGLRQVQVQSSIGLNFANCLRSFLRADPDVIMIGEMRDKETASIGLEASLTGHLVFSTLHTNTAPETIMRLMDMGIDAYNIGNALLGILAQRLVKTLCKECKTTYHPSKEEFEELKYEYGEEIFRKRHEIEYNNKLMLYKAKGCSKCGYTGYKDRTGIHELLVITYDIKRMIINRADIDAIRQKAIDNGMSTLKQDGIMKVFKGDTDLLHVRKVCIR